MKEEIFHEENVVIHHDHCDNDGTDSVDEAILEMLGITSFDTRGIADEGNNQNTDQEIPFSDSDYPCPALSIEHIQSIVDSNGLIGMYKNDAICIFPNELSVPPKTMRRLTDELVYGSSKYQADRSYETIQFIKNGEIGSRRVLTRLENFVLNHPGWRDLCSNHIQKCVSALMEEAMVLFKEKLNLKPFGGGGFAPHLDTPSLRVALGELGPQSFVTVMIAIDDMTQSNGCLKVCKGPWSENNYCEVITADNTCNPDAEGRQGAIPSHVANDQEYSDITVKGGTIVAFNGWVPHRSASNTSPFPRRAVFLTYNPLTEGDFRDLYYQKMNAMRSAYRKKVDHNSEFDIHDNELAALATIPRI